MISASLGSAEHAFASTPAGSGYRLHGGGVTVELARGGPLINAGGGSLSMLLAELGRGAHSSPVGSAVLSTQANRVAYDHAGGVREWYAAGPLGIEQGFTLRRRPAGRGPLTLNLKLAGSLHPQLVASRVLFADRAGRVVLRYGALDVLDGRGRRLPAYLGLQGRSLLLHVDDRGAHYPLRIDPFIQQGPRLTGSGLELASFPEFGNTVAISADGNTALIGAPQDNGVGSVFVFTRTGGVWAQQGPKLTGHEATTAARFGSSLALSGDGSTALVGAFNDESNNGAAWVFTRSGPTWAEQAKLTGAGESGKGEFGLSVALSHDGSTALAGGPTDNSFAGASWVFARSGSTWAEQAKLNHGSEETINGELGQSAGLSADGNTALIGGSGDSGSAGAAWVYTRSGATWSEQGGKLTGSEDSKAELGYSASLSAAGDTALLGGPFDSSLTGGAWVFARSGSTWTQQGAKLTGGGGVGSSRFGWSVALSGEGGTALVGGPFDQGGVGAAWVFGRSGSTWAQQGAKLLGGSEQTLAGNGDFGIGVALSFDGDTALIGGEDENLASVFVNPPPSVTTGVASGVGTTGATLNGGVGAGTSNSSYFQYGASAAYTAASAPQSIGASAIPTALAATVAGLSPATTYHFRAVSENSGGISYGADQTFTTASPPLIPPVTGTRPIVTNAAESHRSWREGGKLARISRKIRPPLGTTFSFTLNEQASVSFVFTQPVPGRRLRGRCVAQTRANRHERACKRSITRATLTFSGHAGSNKVAFQGRVSRSKKLSSGTYTVIITATNTLGQRSTPKELSFTIVR